MEWIYLFLAISCELAGTISLKMSDGFSKPLPTVLMVLFYIPAFFLLGLAATKIEVGTAYAIWSGLGTALMATVGIVYFHEIVTTPKVAGLILVIAGVLLLNLSSGH